MHRSSHQLGSIEHALRELKLRFLEKCGDGEEDEKAVVKVTPSGLESVLRSYGVSVTPIELENMLAVETSSTKASAKSAAESTGGEEDGKGGAEKQQGDEKPAYVPLDDLLTSMPMWDAISVSGRRGSRATTLGSNCRNKPSPERPCPSRKHGPHGSVRRKIWRSYKKPSLSLWRGSS